MKIAGYTPAEIKKAIVAFVGFVLTVLGEALAAGGILPDESLPYVRIALAVGTLYGVYQARNLGRKGQDPTQSIATKEPNPVVD